MPQTAPEGYQILSVTEPFEDYLGPLYYRYDEQGRAWSWMQVGPQHCNGIGTVHGGVLLTMADYVLCLAANDAGVLTVTMQTQFVAAARDGDEIYGVAEMVKRTGRMAFVRGELLAAGERQLLIFSGSVMMPKSPAESLTGT